MSRIWIHSSTLTQKILLLLLAICPPLWKRSPNSLSSTSWVGLIQKSNRPRERHRLGNPVRIVDEPTVCRCPIVSSLQKVAFRAGRHMGFLYGP